MKKKILVLYGGIGDTIMAIEGIANLDIDLIYANKSAYDVLKFLEVDIPIKLFPLPINYQFYTKILYLYYVANLWYKLLNEKPSATFFVSFSPIWIYLPFINSISFNNRHKFMPRINSIQEIIKKI